MAELHALKVKEGAQGIPTILQNLKERAHHHFIS
jgi:hypothetical protein